MVFVLFTFFFIVWRFTIIWFTRDALFAAAPDSTILAIQLQITPKTFQILENTLKNLPLISNRNLDIYDLASLTKGEIAIFVLENWEYAVAIRTDKEQLPIAVFNSYEITHQRVGDDIFLLSRSLLPINGIKSKVNYPFFPRFSTWLGRIEMPRDSVSGSVIWHDKNIEIHIKSPASEKLTKNPLQTSMLHVFNLNWNKEHLPLLSSFYQNQTSQFIDFLLNSDEVLIGKNPNGTTQILISSDNNLNWSNEQIIGLLKSVGSYLSPKTEGKILKDGTTAKEILLSPQSIIIEKFDVLGHSMMKIITDNGLNVYGGLINNKIVFSTSDVLLQNYFDPQTTSCSGNSALVDPKSLLSEMQQNSYHPQFNVFLTLFERITTISIEEKKYSTIVRLCQN